MVWTDINISFEGEAIAGRGRFSEEDCYLLRTGTLNKSRILHIGDIVGRPGREGLRQILPQLVEELEPSLVVANCENVAGGLGVSKKQATELLASGIDVLTTGNHAFRRPDIFETLDNEPRIIRPANYLPSNPGRGATVVEKHGTRFGVLNLAGTVMMKAARSPFLVVNDEIEKLAQLADLVLVDFHAEATSEKVAMGWHLDGKVCAVLGTHTHIQTADARVLPKGTAYMTDIGMTGSRDSVIGIKKELSLERFLTQMPVRFETAEDDVWVMGAVVDTNEQGLAESIQPFMRPVE